MLKKGVFLRVHLANRLFSPDTWGCVSTRWTTDVHRSGEDNGQQSRNWAYAAYNGSLKLYEPPSHLAQNSVFMPQSFEIWYPHWLGEDPVRSIFFEERNILREYVSGNPCNKRIAT